MPGVFFAGFSIRRDKEFGLIYKRDKAFGVGLIRCIVWKFFGEEFFFVREFDSEEDKEKREGNKMSDDRIVQKQPEGGEEESGIHGVADKRVGSADDKGGSLSGFGGDTKLPWAQSHECPEAKCDASEDESPGHNILRSKWLEDRMEEYEIADDQELCCNETFRKP